MKIGVLSDTHGHLDPAILAIFQGVDHILHAGDVGFPSLIMDLESVAPVTAVSGNTDDPRFDLRDLEKIELAHRRFLIHHIVDPKSPSERMQQAFLHYSPEIVVFGHTHRQCHEVINGRLFLNPGYCGAPRHQTPRSVAIIEIDGDNLTVDFYPLGLKSQD